MSTATESSGDPADPSAKTPHKEGEVADDEV